MEPTPRQMRIDSRVRGVIVGGLIAGYTWLMHLPQASFTSSFIIAAALQLAIIIVGRFVPAEQAPKALYVCELLADAATVFLFALGVYGGILRMPPDL
jgi:hypothetical protein